MKKLKTKNYRLKTNRAATLLELMMYVAIVSFLLLALITFAVNILHGGNRNSNQSQTYSEARYLAQRIKFEIRNAAGIDTANSNFGVNLVSSSSNKLTLIGTAPNNPIIFNVSVNKVYIGLGAAQPVAITGTDLKVTNLTFTNLTSSDGKTKNIAFTIDASYTNTQAGKTAENISIQDDAELRSN